MAPREVPSRVIACSYADSGATGAGTSVGSPLGQSRIISDGLDQLAGRLAGMPAWYADGEPTFCTQVGGPAANYLLGLSYPSGTMWVSTATDPNACSGTTNGDFVSRTSLGKDVAYALSTGRWGQSTESWEIIGTWSPVDVPWPAADASDVPGLGNLTFQPDGSLLANDGLNELVGKYRVYDSERFVGHLGKGDADGCLLAGGLAPSGGLACRRVPIAELIDAAKLVRVTDGRLILLDESGRELASFDRAPGP